MTIHMPQLKMIVVPSQFLLFWYLKNEFKYAFAIYTFSQKDYTMPPWVFRKKLCIQRLGPRNRNNVDYV